MGLKKLRNEHLWTRLTTLKPYGSLYHPVYLLRNSLYIKSKMEEPIYSPFFGVLGASSAMVFSALGAAYGTAKSGTGIAAMAVMRPELIMKSVVPVIMAGIVGIYGLVVACLIANSLSGTNYSLFKGFLHLGAGLATG